MGACSTKKKYTNKKDTSSQNKESIIFEKVNTISTLVIHTNRDSSAANNTRIQPPKFAIKELDLLKKTTPFLPHIYNSFSKEEITFYDTVIEIKKEKDTVKTCFTVQDLNLYLENQENKEKRNFIICWRLFKWIKNNIKCVNLEFYNEDRNESGINIDSIIKNKTACPFTISKFVNIILNSFNIENYIIPGYLKGALYKRGSQINQINHVWNGAVINGSHRLIDFASPCENSPYYNHEIETNSHWEYFFCSPPQHLIYTHFPHVIRNTFLTQGNALLDKNVFEKLPWLKMNYFIYGFQMINYKDAEIEVENIELYNSNDSFYLNEITLSFCLPEGIEPFLNFSIVNQNVENGCNDLCYIQKRMFNRDTDKTKINMVDYYFYYEDLLYKTRITDNICNLIERFRIYEVRLRLPKKKMYQLEVFATQKLTNRDTVNPNYCFSYLINAKFENFKELNMNEIFFPQTSEIFTSKFCSIIEPLFFNLKNYFDKTKNINFTLKIPNSKSAAIFYDGEDEFVLMNKKEDNIWTFCHNIQKSFKSLVIAASFDDQFSEYSILVNYTM